VIVVKRVVTQKTLELDRHLLQTAVLPPNAHTLSGLLSWSRTCQSRGMFLTSWSRLSLGIIHLICGGCFHINSVLVSFLIFYRAMHFSAKRGIAIACRLSVCLSVCVSVCL